MCHSLHRNMHPARPVQAPESDQFLGAGVGVESHSAHVQPRSLPLATLDPISAQSRIAAPPPPPPGRFCRCPPNEALRAGSAHLGPVAIGSERRLGRLGVCRLLPPPSAGESVPPPERQAGVPAALPSPSLSADTSLIFSWEGGIGAGAVYTPKRLKPNARKRGGGVEGGVYLGTIKLFRVGRLGYISKGQA